MSTTFEFHVRVTVEKVSGKFAKRTEMAEAISEELQNAVDSLDLSAVGDNESEYEVTDSNIAEVTKRTQT